MSSIVIHHVHSAGDTLSCSQFQERQIHVAMATFHRALAFTCFTFDPSSEPVLVRVREPTRASASPSEHPEPPNRCARVAIRASNGWVTREGASKTRYTTSWQEGDQGLIKISV